MQPTTVENGVQWVELIERTDFFKVTVHFSTQLIYRSAHAQT